MTRVVKKRKSRNRHSQLVLARRTLFVERLDPRLVLSADLVGALPLEAVTYDLGTQLESRVDYAVVEAEVKASNGGVSPTNQNAFVGELGLDGAGSPIVGPLQSVFGNDDRVQVTETRGWPARLTGFLRIKNAAGDWAGCSGSMIGPFHFLTAGHCVHDGGASGDWVDEAYVTLGRNGQSRWYGSAAVTQMHSVNGWTQDGNTEFDWAVVALDRNIGNVVGWNGWSVYDDDAALTGMDVSISGYPADLAASWTNFATDRVDTQMYRSDGALLAPTPAELRYNGTLDTSGGMSGSAVVETRDGSPYAVGIHKTGDGGDGTNEAVRMQEYIGNLVTQWRNTDTPPTDRADLIDWDSWFHTEVSSMNKTRVDPGDSFSVTTFPRNNGTASSGAFSVSFYASSDITITASDNFLGTVNVGSLNSFDWNTAELNVTSFPDIPDGSYYVGWIVDSGETTTEYLETNNTGYIRSQRLEVGGDSDDHGNNSGSATSVGVPSDTQGNIEVASDVDWFSFAAQAGLTYTIETTLNGLSDSTLTLYDTNGTTQLAFDDDGGVGLASKIEWQAPVRGTYFFEVDNFSNEIGAYIASIESSSSDDHGDNAGAATPILVPSNTNGFIELADDTDWFSFVASEGTSYTFEARLASLEDPVLTLYDTDGTTQLATDDDSGSGLSPLIAWVAPADGRYYLQVDNKADAVGSYVLRAGIPAPAVVGRKLFYDGSAFDGDALVHSTNDDAAIDSSKEALLPGESASFENYSGYVKGINGVMVDVVNLPATPTPADFVFRIGNSNDVDAWETLTTAPTIQVRPGEGIDGSSRISLIWPEDTIKNQWLQVTVRSDGPNAIVDTADVHYWGNQIAEVGNSATSTAVNAVDFGGVSANFSGFSLVPVTSAYDVNKDRRINAVDASNVSANFSGFSPTLRLIDAPEGFDVFQLASKPDAEHVLYLDFDGHTTTGTIWNSQYNINTIVSPPFSLDADPDTFSELERDRIFAAWLEVAEDFAPFDINVTTIEPDLEDLRNTGGSDTRWGARAVVTNDTFANCSCGGHAYLSTFASSVDTPTFVYNKTLNSLGETVSHEVGHMLNLRHDGNASQTYYPGHGSGEISWGVLMGAAFGENVTQWNNGDYVGANNTENDLAIITSSTNGVDYRVDDYGDSTAAATAFPSGTSVTAFGIIEQNTDKDYFSMNVGSGQLTITVDPASYKPNLDVFAALYDASGNLVASSIPEAELSATIDINVAAGVYYLRVEGVGSHDVFDVASDTVQQPANPPWQTSPPVGFSDYGSLGQYQIIAQLPASGQQESGFLPGNFGRGAAHAHQQLLRTFAPNPDYGGGYIDPEPLPYLHDELHAHDDLVNLPLKEHGIAPLDAPRGVPDVGYSNPLSFATPLFYGDPAVRDQLAASDAAGTADEVLQSHADRCIQVLFPNNQGAGPSTVSSQYGPQPDEALSFDAVFDKIISEDDERDDLFGTMRS